MLLPIVSEMRFTRIFHYLELLRISFCVHVVGQDLGLLPTKLKKNLLKQILIQYLCTLIIFFKNSTKLFVDKSKYFCETYLLFHHNFTAD